MFLSRFIRFFVICFLCIGLNSASAEPFSENITLLSSKNPQTALLRQQTLNAAGVWTWDFLLDPSHSALPKKQIAVAVVGVAATTTFALFYFGYFSKAILFQLSFLTPFAMAAIIKAISEIPVLYQLEHPKHGRVDVIEDKPHNDYGRVLIILIKGEKRTFIANKMGRDWRRVRAGSKPLPPPTVLQPRKTANPPGTQQPLENRLKKDQAPPVLLHPPLKQERSENKSRAAPDRDLPWHSLSSPEENTASTLPTTDHKHLEGLISTLGNSNAKEKELEGTAIALQRPWDGISAQQRREILQKLNALGTTERFSSDFVIALQRPIFCSLTPAEMAIHPKKYSIQEWNSLSRTQRIGVLRLWVRQVQKDKKRELIFFQDLLDVSGLPLQQLRDFFSILRLPHTAASVISNFHSEAQVWAALWQLRKNPNEPITIDALTAYLGKGIGMFLTWAQRHSKQPAPKYLFERFGLHRRRIIDVNSDLQPAHLTAGFRRYKTTHGFEITEDPERIPSPDEVRHMQTLLQSLAKTAKTTVEQLEKRHYEKSYAVVDGMNVSLFPFYLSMIKSAKTSGTDYRTPYWIAMRYGLATKFNPLDQIRTAKEFMAVLAAKAIRATVAFPYHRLTPEIHKALHKLAKRELQKPTSQFNRDDWERVRFGPLTDLCETLTGKTYYRHFKRIASIAAVSAVLHEILQAPKSSPRQSLASRA